MIHFICNPTIEKGRAIIFSSKYSKISENSAHFFPHSPAYISIKTATNMPSLVSKKTAAPSFLLTFQGVDFRLDPKECGASISFDHADNGKVILKLANFSGCLQVTTSTTTTPDAVTPTKTPSGRVSLSPERAKPGPKKKTKAPRKKTVGKVRRSFGYCSVEV